MRRENRHRAPITLALAAAPLLAASAHAAPLELDVEGVVVDAAVNSLVLGEIGEGDLVRWTQTIDLELGTSLATLSLRPDGEDALVVDFDGTAEGRDASGALIAGYLNHDLDVQDDGTGVLTVAGRDDHPGHSGWSVIVSLTIDGLERRSPDGPRDPFSPTAPEPAWTAIDATLVTGRLYAYDHLARQYRWIATVDLAPSAPTSAAVVVPAPAAALLGAAGLVGVALRRRRL